ncbi:hypothetical protein MF672_016235 [Actinomadura sp. ATCC 31491]|uniref:CMP/dCMP-type deaminase domain-containing protein n=1 Tax=Actinomadura luzonensis TaxID=2805427 RepID=A0ABT0FSR8_9ACTN|nr:hypothetical protein [Actinomadura luzonensis]MCK2215324.1 hypothetical protein [Actinomadura luzonensis]
MSTMYEEKPKRQRGAVFNANAIGGAWAEHVVATAALVASQNQPMAAGQATSCRMSWGPHHVYDGHSSSGYHGEIDCLNQAYLAGATLGAGTFQALSNPVCLVCCTVLHAVGITTVPAKAGGSKEYGNYSLPGWVFDDEAPGGVLSNVLGGTAYEAWMKLSDEARKRADNRSELIKQMVALLRKY